MKINFTKFRKIVVGVMMAMIITSSPVVATAATNKKIVKAESKTTLKLNTTPVILGIKAPVVLKTNEIGTWVVKASDPQNSPLEYSVNWGDELSTSLRSMFDADVFTQTSTFTHAYTKAGVYKITFTVKNELGQKTVSSVTVNVIKPALSIPVISDLYATSTKTDKGTVSWKTDVNATSKVWFSTTTPVDTSMPAQITKNGKITNHIIQLKNLLPDTTYYVVVGSENGAGSVTSAETSFHTKSEVNQLAPVITDIMASSTIPAGEVEEVTVEAFDPQNSPLEYSVDWGDSPLMMKLLSFILPDEVFIQTSTFSHIYENPGTYTAVFKVRNELGLETSHSLVITVTEPLPDTTAPVISEIPKDITVTATSTLGAYVMFNTPIATDTIDGNVTVTCSPVSGSLFPIGTTTTTCSASDNSHNTSESTFNVIVLPDLESPTIGDVVHTTGSTTSTISWTTNENTRGKVFYSLTSPVDGTSSTTPFVSDTEVGTSHTITVSSLATSTPYYFIIQATDLSNNVNTSSEMMFTTSSGM